MLNRLEDFLYKEDNTPQENMNRAENMLISILGNKENATAFFLQVKLLLDKFDEADSNSLKEVMAEIFSGNNVFELVSHRPNFNILNPTPNVLGILKQLQNALEQRKVEITAGAEPSPGLLGTYYYSVKLYSLKEICDALDINKRTFIKWLNVFFKDRFDNRKKITLKEHIEIVSAFMLAKKESHFNFDKNAADYASRLAEGLMLNKTEIAKRCGSNLKALAKHLEDKFEFYKSMDKFPYSITQEFIERMNGT